MLLNEILKRKHNFLAVKSINNQKSTYIWTQILQLHLYGKGI